MDLSCRFMHEGCMKAGPDLRAERRLPGLHRGWPDKALASRQVASTSTRRPKSPGASTCPQGARWPDTTGASTARSPPCPRPAARRARSRRRSTGATERPAAGRSPARRPHRRRSRDLRGAHLRRRRRPEPGDQRVGEPRRGRFCDPGDIAVWADQDGGRGADDAEYRKLPLAGVRRLDQLDPVSP